MNESYHIPVLLQESVEGLIGNKNGRYVDVTFGGGGHSGALLQELEEGELLAFDRDPEAHDNAISDNRFSIVREDFKFLEKVLEEKGWNRVDGILADLGISSHQIDTPARGFSHRFDGPLDMRMNPAVGETAADVLNEWEEAELAQMFWRYGEISNSRKLARIIVEEREGARIQSTKQLETLIQSCVPSKRKTKYLSQVFQALRIEVNGEMEGLEHLLVGAMHRLKIGGRLAVIAYHSLEDRMVKRFLRSGNFQDKLEKDLYGRPLTPWKLITRKAIQPSEAEIQRNSRARSARLRIAERIEIRQP
ncbi:MAG: 16S rRNA (cytosine(1402)-N(4))-methyltransferase RsmH [Bacteroidota bacterium]